MAQTMERNRLMSEPRGTHLNILKLKQEHRVPCQHSSVKDNFYPQKNLSLKGT